MKTVVYFGFICVACAWPACGRAAEPDDLHREFQQLVRPFLATYCVGCHGSVDPQAKFNVSPYDSLDAVVGDLGHWELILERVGAGEMPPDDAEKRPDDALRGRVVSWIERVRRHEAARHAGDPGPVLARRLSNAEYDYTIHDLTGVDIQPTREFPLDPANEAGFDNSGESLSMSPALLNKYLAAARQVADRLVLLPDGLGFAPHPAVIYSDRDKFAVHRIVDFYQQQPIDYADYFLAAWRYRHRDALGTPAATLEDVAGVQHVSAKYLHLLWDLLTDSADDAGPIAALRARWNQLPGHDGSSRADAEDPERDSIRAACTALGRFVTEQRREFDLPEFQRDVKQLNRSCQPIVLWKNREIAANRRLGKLPAADGTNETEQRRQAVARFCSVFPDTFFVSERGRMFLAPKDRNTGRLLSAGFHLMVGYFRDDAPLYDLVLDSQQQRQLDDLWRELDFITDAPVRQLSDFVYFERAEYPGFLKAAEFDFVREDADVTSPEKMQQLATLYLTHARAAEIDEPVLRVIEAYFKDMAAGIRRLEQSRNDAQPRHLDALLALAERAWRRPLTDDERADLLDFYDALRNDEGLNHEEAVRDVLVAVLMSPRFCYHTTTLKDGADTVPLSDDELANRLSYFLWSSLPDTELTERAAAGDLHQPDVLLGQTRRMLRDPRARRLAVEFAGNWLDFRQFESHNGVNRDRFPMFTPELRQAMFEEPVRFFTDLVHRDGSVLELLDANHTFVNAVLAEHYGMPYADDDAEAWGRVDDADRFGRGGLLPMSVFLTQNSPGLRTSPVKRGYWVVRRLLGEHIPPPPPAVPELPEDEAELGELSLREVLARHRESKSCAACHRRFDAIGLVFEAYGPVGQRRTVDLGGRPVNTLAEFPDGSEGEGLEGLKSYLLAARQADFVDNLCRKLLAYALGRSLRLSDDLTLDLMKERLAAQEYRITGLIETVVTSPQFTHKRGRDYPNVADIGVEQEATE